MKKTMKRLAAVAVTLGLILAMSVSVFAAAVTKEDAVRTALTDAGIRQSGTAWLKAERDGKTYEVEFKDANTGDKYEYAVLIKNGKIKEADVDYAHSFNSSRKKIGKTKAVSAAAKAAGVKKSVVKQGTCTYKKDDGEWIYKLKFKTNNCRYEVEVQAATGKVIEISRKYQ